MPAGIAAVVVAVAAGVVEVCAEDSVADPDDALVVYEGAQPLAVLDGAAEHGALAAVVLRAIAVGLDGVLKLLGDPGDFVGGKKLREVEIAEALEEANLRGRKFHEGSSPG